MFKIVILIYKIIWGFRGIIKLNDVMKRKKGNKSKVLKFTGV